MSMVQSSNVIATPLGSINTERLITDLHSTLEVHQLLDTFNGYLKDFIGITGLQYECPRFKLRYMLGDVTGHTVEHLLSVNELNLGNLQYIRSHNPFGEDEIHSIEALSNLFLLPLRNCLRYFEAIEASLTDKLTQINNRAAFDKILEKEISSANRYNLPLSLLLIDIDDFKRVNDTFGHEIGDIVLQSVAKCLVDISRQSDMVYRYGGEEFAILMSHTGQEGAFALGNRICSAINAMDLTNKLQHPVQVTVSIGISSKNNGPIQPDTFFENCDNALYQAKKTGKNKVVHCDN